MTVKSTNNFRVLFDQLGKSSDTSALTEHVISITRPRLYPHNPPPLVAPTELTLVVDDDVANTASKLIQKQVQSNGTFDMTIQTLATNETVVEEWLCKKCHFVYVDYGKFDLSDFAQTLQITIHIQCDRMSQILKG